MREFIHRATPVLLAALAGTNLAFTVRDPNIVNCMWSGFCFGCFLVTVKNQRVSR